MPLAPGEQTLSNIGSSHQYGIRLAKRRHRNRYQAGGVVTASKAAASATFATASRQNKSGGGIDWATSEEARSAKTALGAEKLTAKMALSRYGI